MTAGKLALGARSVVFGLTTAGALAAAGSAQAQTCFSAFGGTIKYRFEVAPATLQTAGNRSFAGEIAGALSPCAGLNRWPLIATALTKTATSQVILGFRAMSVDAASCGAADYIVNLNRRTLRGPLQLHNDRNNVSNSSTMVPISCALYPSLAAPQALPQRGRDAAGN